MLKKPPGLPPAVDELWDEFAPQFSPRIGSVGLEAALSTVVRLRAARARIDEEGEIVADLKGNPVPHPALATERASGAELRQWVKQFGVRRP